MSTDERPDNQKGKEDGATKCDQQTRPQGVVPPPAPPSSGATDKDNQEEKGFCEKWKYEIEFAGLIGLIFYCIINWMEWRTFDSERKTMENEYTSSQAAADKQLAALQGQLNEMKRTSELEERPWIFCTMQDNSLDIQSSSCVVTIILKNTGKTPVVNFATTENSTANPTDIKDVDPKAEGLKYFLIPTDVYGLRYPIPQNMVLALQHGKTIYVFGTIYYFDIFGRQHWTEFCYSISNGGRNFQQTLFHNNCDEIETNQTN